MCDIDQIMSMLDWNNPLEIQMKGIELARSLNRIDLFLQPISEKYNKNVWDNCSKILCSKDDTELEPYLVPLLEWLQDLTWPGALAIKSRLKNYRGMLLTHVKDTCLKQALAENDLVWYDNMLHI